jgi:hypothetical protein
MWLDLAHIHRPVPHAAGTDLGHHLGGLLDVMVLDKGWHVGSPLEAKSTMDHNQGLD